MEVKDVYDEVHACMCMTALLGHSSQSPIGDPPGAAAAPQTTASAFAFAFGVVVVVSLS